MELQKRICEIAGKHLPDASIFLVDVVIKGESPKKVLVLIDGDQGVSIDVCADLSRAIGNEIEEENVIEDAYRLEVSSPGVDYPLKSIRQYKKNIGRMIKISLPDKDIKGLLKAVDQTNVLIDQEVKNKKKKEYKEVEIPFENIKKTIVQISFK